MWWSNHIVLAHVSKVAKNLCVVCENITRVYKCLILWWFEIWENQFNSHTIITAWWGLSPSRYILQLPHLLETRLQPYLKAFWFFLLLYSLPFFFFFFEHIMHEHIEERKEIPNYVKPQTSQFCYAEAHRYYTWLAGFSDEMVIYAFLLGFFSHSCKKEWYKF